jgi:hypothetical protein
MSWAATAVAQTGLVPCENDCKFEDFFKLINNLIEFALTKLLFPFFIVAIFVLAWTYLSAQGNASKIGKVKTMIWHIIFGVLLILLAWIIVRSILVFMGVEDALLFLR